MCLTRCSGNPTRKHCEPMKYSAEKKYKKIKNIYYSKPWYMYFTFIKTEIVCALVYSEGTAVVVVTVILGRHGVMASWLLPAIGFLNIPRGPFVFRFSLWMDHIFFLRTVYWLYDKGLSSKTFWQKLIQNWAFDFIWKKYRSTRTLRKFIPGNCRWNWSKLCYFTFHEVSFRPFTGNGQNLINLPKIRFVEQ